jgi:AcrR family transcriptional regulator
LARTHEGAPGLPRGRSRLPAATVRAAQRDRLIKAMTAAAAEHGFGQVTIADVVSRARVSRTAFYEHFTDKEDCFFQAAADGALALLAHTVAAVRALDREAPDVDRLRVGLRAFLGFLSAEPAFARVFYVELPAAGRRAQQRLQAAYTRWAALNERWHRRARERNPSWPDVPREAHRALAGATGELVRDVVATGRLEQLTALEDILVALHLSVLAGQAWPTPAL